MAVEITPRAALRTINDTQNSLKAVGKAERITNKPGCVHPLNNIFKKEIDTLRTKEQMMQIHTDPRERQAELKVSTKEKVVTEDPEPFEEKEYLYIYDPEEDLKPKVDKALIGLAGRICNWRPPCLFGVGKPENLYDHDDDDHLSLPEDEDEDILPPMEDSFGEVNLSDVLITIDDIPMPEIEDLPILDTDDPLFMGKLKILDTSSSTSPYH